jgi:hypothetical protein
VGFNHGAGSDVSRDDQKSSFDYVLPSIESMNRAKLENKLSLGVILGFINQTISQENYGPSPFQVPNSPSSPTTPSIMSLTGKSSKSRHHVQNTNTSRAFHIPKVNKVESEINNCCSPSSTSYLSVREEEKRKVDISKLTKSIYDILNLTPITMIYIPKYMVNIISPQLHCYDDTYNGRTSLYFQSDKKLGSLDNIELGISRVSVGRGSGGPTSLDICFY